MAVLSSFPDQSCIFMGNPIVYTFLPMQIQGDNIAFHRIKMNVTIQNHEFELSQPVDDDSVPVEFDISGCFRAVAELYEPAPVVSRTDFPVFTTSKIWVKDVWVEDGVLRTSEHLTASDRSAIMGAYSDYERLHGDLSSSFSRKPAYGELVFQGDKVVIPVGSSRAPSSVAHEVSLSASGALNIQGHTLFVVPPQKNSFQFQFFNSKGCIESVRAWSVDVQRMKSQKSTSVFSRFERFDKFSRTFQTKQMAPSEFTMTSGFVDYAWACWWAYEFCAASRHWMLYEGRWIPCNVTVDESLTIIERSKVNMCSVQFTVTPDVNGALW